MYASMPSKVGFILRYQTCKFCHTIPPHSPMGPALFIGFSAALLTLTKTVRTCKITTCMQTVQCTSVEGEFSKWLQWFSQVCFIHLAPKTDCQTARYNMSPDFICAGVANLCRVIGNYRKLLIYSVIRMNRQKYI